MATISKGKLFEILDLSEDVFTNVISKQVREMQSSMATLGAERWRVYAVTTKNEQAAEMLQPYGPSVFLGTVGSRSGAVSAREKHLKWLKEYNEK